MALKSEDSPDFRIGGREGGGRRAALVEDQPARIVAECVDAQMPPHLHVRTESSQVVLDFAFGNIGKKTGGAGTHKRHTGHAHGRTPWHTDHTDEPHNHVPSKPTNTPARYSATTGTGLAARPLPVT